MSQTPSRATGSAKGSQAKGSGPGKGGHVNGRSARAAEPTAACAPLIDIIRGRILPWTQQGMARVVVGTPRLAGLRAVNRELPPGVTVSPHKLQGKRVTLRGKRRLEIYGPIYAIWPDDGLCVKNEPMLACVVGGHSDFCLGEYTVHCPAGTFIFIPPGVPHPSGFSHLHKDKGHNVTCDIMWLSFWEKLLRCWVCHSRGQEHEPPRPGESAFVGQDGIGEHFRGLIREAEERNPHYSGVCASLMFVVFTVLLRLIEDGRLLQTYGWESLQPEGADRHKAMTDCREYIRNHLSKPLTLANVGRAVGMSRTRLAAEFSSRTGQTFTQYLTACRLDQAEQLLRTTDWPVTLISTMVGLKPTRLREVFHEAHGVSPTVYRQREAA